MELRVSTQAVSCNKHSGNQYRYCKTNLNYEYKAQLWWTCQGLSYNRAQTVINCRLMSCELYDRAVWYRLLMFPSNVVLLPSFQDTNARTMEAADFPDSGNHLLNYTAL